VHGCCGSCRGAWLGVVTCVQRERERGGGIYARCRFEGLRSGVMGDGDGVGGAFVREWGAGRGVAT
jgi:hypothetical protein